LDLLHLSCEGGALARLAGVPLSTLRDWEHGRRYMRLESAMRLADALGLTLDELAGRKLKKEG
jgi:transcriptional regulator with XRE-family HTH domain